MWNKFVSFRIGTCRSFVNTELNRQFSYNAGNLLTTRGIASHWRRIVVTCDIKSVDCSPSGHCSSESIGDQHALKTDMFLLCIESALTFGLLEFFREPSQLHTYIHTYTHTHTHTHIHTYIHTYIHSYIRA